MFYQYLSALLSQILTLQCCIFKGNFNNGMLSAKNGI